LRAATRNERDLQRMTLAQGASRLGGVVVQRQGPMMQVGSCRVWCRIQNQIQNSAEFFEPLLIELASEFDFHLNQDVGRS
jgi:hypothetical protein